MEVVVFAGWCVFFFQAEDGIRDLVRSRGLGDVYKRQGGNWFISFSVSIWIFTFLRIRIINIFIVAGLWRFCLLYTSDAADERSSVDLGGRRIIKKKTPQSLV